MIIDLGNLLLAVCDVFLYLSPPAGCLPAEGLPQQLRFGLVQRRLDLLLPREAPLPTSHSVVFAVLRVAFTPRRSLPCRRNAIFDCWWALFGNRAAGKRPREGHSVF
jgi:hypothetical protein